MPWVTFTAADIRDGLAVREIAIYEQTAGKDFDGVVEEGNQNRIDRIASRTVEQFRGIIASNPSVASLGPEGTIPAFCLTWAIAIARNSLMSLNPVEEGKTDPRREEYLEAIKGRDSLAKLQAIAFAVVDTPTPTAISESFASYGGNPFINF